MRAFLAIVLTAFVLIAPAPAHAADYEPVEPVWTEQPIGFAALPGHGLETTTGGAGGQAVVVDTQAELEHYAGAAEPYTIKVQGSITVEPFGKEIAVASNKSIIGLGTGAEIVHGGFRLINVSNVIIRNLTIRDTYVAGDWDGKTHDFDGIQVDTSHHIWIDHNRIQRTGDGLVDLRKDIDFVTLSWNVFADHNKAVGIGWTSNVVTKVTVHHNWFRNTFQRNPSVDRTEAAHLFNNYFQNIGYYGSMIRGPGRMVVENSYYDTVTDPIVVKDPDSQLVQRGNIFSGTRGRRDRNGAAFDPSSYYSYRMDPASEVPALVRRHAGPRGKEEPRETITVALDGSGDVGSLQAAIGMAATGPATIVVKPGVYREIVRIWPDRHNITISGATGDPKDVVITYGTAAGAQKFYGGLEGIAGSPTLANHASDIIFENLTVENSYDEAANGPSQALAVRTLGDRVVFRNTRFLGNQDTFMLDTPAKTDIRRTYLHDCYVEGDVDFIYGRGTGVFDRCVIHSVARGLGVVTAAATTDSNPYGFLINRSEFTSDAPAGSVYLGRPWHPNGDPTAIAQVLVRESTLGAHVNAAPWTDMAEFSWRDARFSEYRNTGPGATPGPDRPQLPDTEADKYTMQRYLGDWQPS
ncbi:pectinesterase family protein [Nonomuraea sp. 3N208]|uniref:pectinesterase family protein n=1 Tax=Nonomuraea sp. 3N208 TaxID=3457421 RepID=UPI003FD0E64A